jgi:hypothetical protein
MSKFISNLVQQILDAAYIVRTVGLEAPDEDADDEVAMAMRSLRGAVEERGWKEVEDE